MNNMVINIITIFALLIQIRGRCVLRI